MKKTKLSRIALTFSVVVVCMFGLAACSSSESSSSEGVAATVNGTEIKEQTITDQVENIRKQSNITDDDQWGQFLVQNDMTPSSIRDQILDSQIEQELIKQGASELGITVEDSEVDEYIDKMKANYDDDEAWQKALEQANLTEDEYRKTIKDSLYEQKVGDHFEDEAKVTDEDYVTAAKTYVSTYDGAKRSSHILFKVDDKDDDAAMDEAMAKANDVLAQINAGTLDFADAAKQYSGDTGSAENGGDVGWDKLNSFVAEYTNTLNNLELNQVSEPVKSEYGVHIIKCTEVFNAPEEITSLDQIPEAFRDNIKEMATSTKGNSAYQDWLQGLKDKADIKKNDMPSGLPYDIDMTKYEEEAEKEQNESPAMSSEDAEDTEVTEVEKTTESEESTENTETTESKASSSSSAE